MNRFYTESDRYCSHTPEQCQDYFISALFTLTKHTLSGRGTWICTLFSPHALDVLLVELKFLCRSMLTSVLSNMCGESVKCS